MVQTRAQAASVASQSANKRSTLMHGVAAVFAILLWGFFSSALIVVNKRIYAQFPHPCFMTGLGQVFSALGGIAVVQVGSATLRPVPPLKFWTFRLLPIIVSTAATMFFGNAAYLTLSVAFIQIIKAFTPALTLALCVLGGVERMQPTLLLSMGLITLGTLSAVVVESGTPSFALVGFLHFMASSLTEAARVVGAEVLLAGERFNSAEALIYIGGPTAVLLLTASAVAEGPTIWAVTGRLAMQQPWPIFWASVLSFLVNLSCFFAIQLTSSLTFKVAGCLKNVAVVWYGIAAHGENVSHLQMMGYALSVIGFVLYSNFKAKGSGKGTKQQPTLQKRTYESQPPYKSKAK